MSVEPAAWAPGCSQDAGWPPDAWPINMARENCLLLRIVAHARTAAARSTIGSAAFAWHVVCVIGCSGHLFVSLAAHGGHPAAWRVSGEPGFAGAAPFL